MPARRVEQVSGLILKEAAGILLRDVKDPRVDGVTLTAVSIGADLKAAKIYFRTLDVTGRARAQAGLQSATGYIRREIGRGLRLRNNPTLEFCYDETVDQANRLEALFQQARTGKDQ